MNRYDKEERIIELFQEISRFKIKIFPNNIKTWWIFKTIHNKYIWKTWVNSSSKSDLPPDYYNNKYKLMMDVMRIDDHAYEDKNGKIINLHNERESKLIEELISKNESIREMANAGKIFITPFTGKLGREDHNYNLYVKNFKRVVEKHIKKIEKYKNNHPGFKTIFFVFDESTPYMKLVNCEAPKNPGDLMHGELHYWWKDSNMLDVIKNSNIDCLIWLTPYKHFDSVQKVRYPLAVIYDVSKINFNKNIKYEIDELESMEQ